MDWRQRCLRKQHVLWSDVAWITDYGPIHSGLSRWSRERVGQVMRGEPARGFERVPGVPHRERARRGR